MYRDFEEVVKAVKARAQKRVVAVAAAQDAPIVEACLHAQREGLAEPIFVGDAPAIRRLLEEAGEDPGRFAIQPAPHGAQAQAAVDLVREGAANILMKGLLDTRDILGAIVDRKNDLRTGGVMSHLAFNSIPTYHKLVVHTDGGMVIYPTREEKRAIIRNAVDTLRAMGYAEPKLALLAGVEKPNPRMVETMDAAALKQEWLAGEFPGCFIEGPLSYDIAMSREIAAHKNHPCPHCGDFDVLVVPSLAAGNLMGKALVVSARARMAGIVVGARAPISLTSRGSTADEKYYSIALASLAAAGSQASGI